MTSFSIDINLVRGDFHLNVATSLPDHGVTAISGASGSGKTTLLRAIAGLEPMASATVHLGSNQWTSNAPPAHKRLIGMVFQEPRLFPHLDTFANLAYGAKRAGIGTDHIPDLADALDITRLLGRRVKGLSGGEQRRVALARALAMKPRLLLLDEPLTGLDKATKADLLPFLSGAAARAQCPALYVSHDEMEITALADQVLHIAKGQMVHDGCRPVSNSIELPVIAASSGRVQLRIGTAEFWIDGQGTKGQVRRVFVPSDSVLVSEEKPENTSAQFSFAARLQSMDAATGALTFIVEDQYLTVSGRLSPEPQIDQFYWLTPFGSKLMPSRDI